MSSSEGMGGGFAGGKEGKKSNFSVMCSLLSRHLKDKGSFGDLARSLDAKGISTPQTSRKMGLLPVMNPNAERRLESSNPVALPDLNTIRQSDALAPQRQDAHFRPNPPAREVRKKPEQLTIFYGGKVLVFNNFPVEKAKEIVAMAGATPTTPQNPASFVDRSTRPPPQNASPASTSDKNPVAVDTSIATIAPPRPAHLPIASDLPIARRVSLNRFLEKRKGRINSKAPYQVEEEGSPDVASSSKAHQGGAAFPGRGKSEEDSSSGKPGKKIIAFQADGNPEPTVVDLLAFGKHEETVAAASASFRTSKEEEEEEEEKQPWLGLATPSSSNLSEFYPKR